MKRKDLLYLAVDLYGKIWRLKILESDERKEWGKNFDMVSSFMENGKSNINFAIIIDN